MKNKKLFKILLSTTSITTLSLTSVMTISCGHKKTPPPDLSSWEQFENYALSEKAFNIANDHINATPNWKNLVASQFTVKFNPDTKKKTITAVVTRKVQLWDDTQATYIIEYHAGVLYDVSNWTCTIPPIGPSQSWNNFKKAAMTATVQELFQLAKSTKVIDKLTWTYGTDPQRRWSSINGAEFDTTRGTIKGSSSAFKGMHGQPTADDATKTVTAIFCKVNPDIPDYAADPIKAMITYSKPDQIYNINDWTFSATKQLQSKEAAAENGVASAWNFAKAKEWTNFQKDNWFILIGGKIPTNTASNHHYSTKNGNLIRVLNDNSYKEISATGQGLGYVDGSKTVFDTELKKDNKTIGVRTWMQISFNSYKSDYRLTTFFDHMYINNTNDKWDDSKGGNVFSHVWTITDIHLVH